jgi:uncharacterized protein (DUF2249 family)
MIIDSSICPYQVNINCTRLGRDCEPLSKGCVLDGKVGVLKLEQEVGGMSEKVETLDLRPMPPFERHDRIFKIWDSLRSGETLKIINDHNPKPLRYQFEAEYKGKYEWEYEQEGPKDWVVKIRRI